MLTPGKRLLQRGEGKRVQLRWHLAERHLPALAGNDPGCRLRRMQVPGQHPVDGLATVRFGLLGEGPVGRIDPQQVVEAVPVQLRRFQQVRVDQHAQGVSRGPFRLTKQTGRRRQADRRAGPQPEQPEGSRRVKFAGAARAGQSSEAYLERGSHCQVAHPQLIQPAPRLGPFRHHAWRAVRRRS